MCNPHPRPSPYKLDRPLQRHLVHGPIVSTGQIFIDEKLEQEIMALEPYANRTEIERLKNVDDGIYATESSTGAMTLLDTEPLDGVDYKNGAVVYTTLMVLMLTFGRAESKPKPEP
ncbi:uncharacterized protein ACHE_80093S [Aspergillus chevalieri]|uniref:Uncharacterized protein n=1 Tax=Aspergillus chevalieri TaxID=182096 RepID=A0A7R7ZRU5_ASPCH|nr:uncharacterized protein ACHE_80093S [Aspergillus chevalieri]BCR92193.1 hypothetical protein ACHE_80093S [Aspergillus chevalieri]